jgi:hypothetical protein
MHIIALDKPTKREVLYLTLHEPFENARCC